MENRVFGCSEFSDLIFKQSLTLLEKVLDYILEDQGIGGAAERGKVMKMGFYANESSRQLNILVEIFRDEELQQYHERFSSMMPEYMRDPVDYYK